jgi:hypothetical protein
MKLLTQEVLLELPPLGANDSEDPMVWLKFFTPDAQWTWYATEGEYEPETGDYTFFGYVVGIYPEWGGFRLSELRKVRGQLGLPVERDRHFRPKRFSQLNLPREVELSIAGDESGSLTCRSSFWQLRY